MGLIDCEVYGIQVEVVEIFKGLLPQTGNSILLLTTTNNNTAVSLFMPEFFNLLSSNLQKPRKLVCIEKLLQEFVCFFERALEGLPKRTRDFAIHKKVIQVIWDICCQEPYKRHKKYLVINYFKMAKMYLRSHEDILMRSLVSHGFCQNCIELLAQSKFRDNMVSAICQEVLNYIAIENCSKLIDIFVKNTICFFLEGFSCLFEKAAQEKRRNP